MRLQALSITDRNCFLSAYALAGEDGERLEKAKRDLREFRIGKLVGRIGGSVVVPVAVECRVGDHHGGVSLAPERVVVTPGDAGNEAERRHGLQWEIGLGAKRRSEPPPWRSWSGSPIRSR